MLSFKKIALLLLVILNFLHADVEEAVNLYGEEKYDKAYQKFNQYCEDKDGKACNYLGLMYYYGKGVDKDVDFAVSSLQKSCNRDNPMGCYNLAKLSKEPDSFKLEHNKAYELFKKAYDLYKVGCDKNRDDGASCYGLADMFYYGDGFKRNRQNAYNYYKKSCDNKNAMGCFKVANMKEIGDGTYIDKLGAIKFYANACDANVARACHKLGVKHAYGDGVKKDIKKAVSYFHKACSLGIENSCISYSNLNGHK